MDFEQYRVLWSRLGYVLDERFKGQPNERRMIEMLMMARKKLKYDYPHHDEQLNGWKIFDSSQGYEEEIV